MAREADGSSQTLPTFDGVPPGESGARGAPAITGTSPRRTRPYVGRRRAAAATSCAAATVRTAFPRPERQDSGGGTTAVDGSRDTDPTVAAGGGGLTADLSGESGKRRRNVDSYLSLRFRSRRRGTANRTFVATKRVWGHVPRGW